MKGSFPLPSVASGCKYVSMNLVLWQSIWFEE
jgi:hypothetical protein